MAKQATVKSNYIEYCQERVSFRGIHNRRKSLILWALSKHSQLTSGEVYQLVGMDCHYGTIRSALSRLHKYKYISGPGNYRILAKGLRFLYAAKHLAPLQQWLIDLGY